MAELLLELLSEEIPARMQTRAAEDLKRLVSDGLRREGLSFTSAKAFATPRRLALVIDGIPERSEDQSIERRGPRVGAPDQAIQGFLKASGLSSLEQAEKRDTGKGEFWFAVQLVAGSDARDELASIITKAIDELPWPKSMRWGQHKRTWVRPLQGVIAQLDGQDIFVSVYVDRSAEAIVQGKRILESGDVTRGHRFLSVGEIKVSGFDDYQSKLRTAHVILDAAERKKIILEGAERLCMNAQVSLSLDHDLLEEVAGLVEWPVPLLGTIDDEFMHVPPEVLIVSMKKHQRYFATSKKDGALANHFVVVANNVARDGGRVIADGNERVLRARLSDAKFFWDQDRKVRLEERLPALENVVFHAKLGTQAERVRRIQYIATRLADRLPEVDQGLVDQAAHLCKADLVSSVVGEFPELQGIMGRYYALNDKLPVAVAEAIGDHYAPVGPNDRCPSNPVSLVVSLADKLEALTAFWSIDEKPTGSRDPFALRRSALGVIRVIVENKIRLNLAPLLCEALRMVDRDRAMYELVVRKKIVETARVEADASGPEPVLVSLTQIASAPFKGEHIDTRAIDLLGFFAERLKVQMREKGVRHDVVDAVFALGGEDDLLRLLARVEAVQSFLATEDGKNLLTAYGRAANIVRAEEKKDKALGAKIAGAPNAALLEQSEEKAVASALDEIEKTVKPALVREDFAGAMKAFAGLRAAIDSFFDKVTVNVTDKPDLRLNRLKLLNQIRATMDSVADFSKIEG